MGIDAIYVPFRVKRTDLQRAVEGLIAVGVKGFNVTAPHKIKIMRFLKRIDRNAAKIQSVNTIINHNGELEGFNTDGIGALGAIGIERLHDASVLILGAGGSARAIAHAFAPEARTIRIVNRTLSKAKELEHSLLREFPKRIFSSSLTDRRMQEYVSSADVIVNASSMGMKDKNRPPVKIEWLHSDQIVFDIVYDPPETTLLKLARRVGARTINGLEMLVQQGRGSFELWTGLAAPILQMRRAVVDEVARNYANG
jgi:shikimate dehydrogenase